MHKVSPLEILPQLFWDETQAGSFFLKVLKGFGFENHWSNSKQQMNHYMQRSGENEGN